MLGPPAQRELISRLGAYFPETQLSWSIRYVQETGDGQLVGAFNPYLDANAISERLDETVGPLNWTTEYKPAPIGKGIVCRLSIFQDGRWVFREDADYFEANSSSPPATHPASGLSVKPKLSADARFKGCFSTSFKRAAAQFGIGRYLKDIPPVLVPVSSVPGREGPDAFVPKTPPRLAPIYLPDADTKPDDEK